MNGVILAGGNGTRLRPYTYVVNKCVLPVYDKPTIYFAIKTQIGLGANRIIIHTRSPGDIQKVLTDEHFEIDIIYDIEEKPRGIAAALYQMRDKIKGSPATIIFGDIYHTFSLNPPINPNNCCIYVSTFFDQKRLHEYGVVELNNLDKVVSFEEKPNIPKGKHAHTGTTFFPDDLVDRLEELEARNGLEGINLTDLACIYLAQEKLDAQVYNGLTSGLQKTNTWHLMPEEA